LKSGDLQKLIRRCLEDFHKRRLQALEELQLKKVLRRKNPYLYKAIGTESATEIVERVLSAHVSSSDETIFGDAVFEPIALAVSGGTVSPSEGVDIAIEMKDKYLAVSVKSGPNPYNSSQRKKQHEQFLQLRSRVMKLKKQYDALLGYCYGQRFAEPARNKIFRERAGQLFWAELTGDPDFYLKLIRLMQESVISKHREQYRQAYQRAVNRYVREFIDDFCNEDGSIDWEKLAHFNSSAPNKYQHLLSHSQSES